MLALEISFWLSVGLLAYSQVGYPALLALLVWLKGVRGDPDAVPGFEPSVSLIVACHNEERVIEEKLANALKLDYPPERLEVIVASDGSTDGTVELAKDVAGGERRVTVLDLPRVGKVRAQDRAVDIARGEVVAFSDANAKWQPDALRHLVGALGQKNVAYACGEVRFLASAGSSQEGLYWRYEMAVRRLESKLGSVTAGNGAIYATHRSSYLVVDPRMGHDLSLPFNMVKRGKRAIAVSRATATEKMVPSVEGEFRRKRRMMSHTWLILIKGGMLNLRGYGALYGLEILSHRLLRYTGPLFHLVALGTSAALAGSAIVYLIALLVQVGVLALAGIARLTGGRSRLLAVPYYYVSMQASLVAGLWDFLRRGTPAVWQPVQEAR